MLLSLAGPDGDRHARQGVNLLAISTHLFVDLIRLNQLAAAIQGE
jgi:hypothetical protein